MVLVVYAGIALIFAYTSPGRLPLAALFLPFILIFVGLYLPLRHVLIHRMEVGDEVALRKRSFMAAGLAGLPTILLVFSSMGQLTVRDILLWGAMTLIMVFYVNRANFFTN